jgi:hypothetical protein
MRRGATLTRWSVRSTAFKFTRRWVCIDPILAYRGRVSWPISIFGKTPARHLGTISAPNLAAAIEKGIEFFVVTAEQQFRVVAELTVETEKWGTASD